MEYISVEEAAIKWNVSERSVRNYCQKGRVEGAVLVGKTWKIPFDAQKPSRKKRLRKIPNSLLERLIIEKKNKLSGGIYHKLQIDLTYNSNHIEGSKLTHEQTRFIFETKTIGLENKTIKVDDIIETINHFRCIDFIIDKANYTLSESFIKQLHRMLKTGTTDSEKDWFALGEYKKLANIVGGQETTLPEVVPYEMKNLIKTYNLSKNKTLHDLIEFHYSFEKIHPFQDGNGRVGRLILFKECLKNNIVPFIIDESLKLFYYRGLREWKNQKGYLLDTCLTAQDRFKKVLDYFKIDY
ncbi:MAG: Fic family protein [Candidatus Riflebacteria bacterium]|nr:Fic family protein [Candidatus Riflebacteria bacterium]